MKKYIFILFALLFQCGYSQFNLVPNYSFEDTLSCPSGVGQIEKAFPWYNPTNNTPDYFHSCFPLPTQYFNQPPRTGLGNAGIILFEDFPNPPTSNQREYIAVPLNNSLASNKKYCVEFYVLFWNWSLFSSSNIGLYLSVDSIYANNKINLPYQPQINNPLNNVIEDTVNWVLISGEYIAQGGEKYITIGNFKNDLNTILDTIPEQDTINYFAYYFIDDVSVTFCDTCTKPVAQFNYAKNDLTASFNNLTTDTVTNWFWDFGDGASTSSVPNPVHVYDSAGTYTVTFVACNFICCDTMTAEISVSVGIDELGIQDLGFRIYPNPSNGEIEVSLNIAVSSENLTLTVSDIPGRKIKDYPVFKNSLTIQTGELDNGIYFLTLYNKDQLIGRKKLVIVK